MEKENKILFTNKPDNLVFLDIETTGLNPAKGAKIVEIAMLKVQNENETQYQTLVNPQQPIPVETTKIHLITDNMVVNCPTFKDIAKDVLDFIKDCILVCHNAMFDITFVYKELLQAGIIPQNFAYIDTLKLARQYFNFESNALSNIASAIGVEVETKHRAMADVLTMQSVAKYLFKNMYIKGVDEIQISNFEYKLKK